MTAFSPPSSHNHPPLRTLRSLLLLALILLATPTYAQSPTPIPQSPTPIPHSPTPIPHPLSPDPRFGIVETFVNPQAATDAGAGYTRAILRWDVIQPTGRDDWQPANVPDPLIAGELSAGREVVGLLIGTPAWAARSAEEFAQHGSKSVPDLFAWEAFVRRMAQHYTGRIHQWIIWNEPDVWDLSHPGSTWAGSESDYANLLKTAYTAIKGVDHSAQVFMAGLTYYWDWEHGRRRYLDRVLDVIAADPDAAANGSYFDGLAYHVYFNPRQTVDVLEETRATLRHYGITGKSVWINETNAPPSADPQEPPWSAPRYRVSQDEQAAFIIQQHALAFAAGAGRVEVYKLRNTADHPESIEPFGLLRADDSRRPAFLAYQVVTHYLGGFRQVTRQTRGDAEVVTFQRDGQSTTVLWTWGRRTTRLALPARSAQAQLVDETGRTQTLIASDGTYVIDLPGAACSNGANCFIGGAPRLLVETGPATTVPSPLVSPTSVATAPSLPAPTPTSTPSPTPSPSPTSVSTSTPSSTPPPSPIPSATSTSDPTSPPTLAPTARPTRPPPVTVASAANAPSPASSSPTTILLLAAAAIVTALVALLVLKKP